MPRHVKTIFYIILLFLSYLLIPIITVFLSGACNATMDTIDQHWDISIFSDLPDDQFKSWIHGDIEIGKGQWWMFGPVYIIMNGWHCNKQLMGWFLIMGFAWHLWILFRSSLFNCFHNSKWIEFYIFIYCILLIIVWTAGFELFYSHLWLK